MKQSTKKNNKSASDFINEFFPKELTTGRAIRAKRKNYGITLEEVSKITGISVTNLSAIENDKKTIGLKTAIKIGAAIGLHPSTILFPNNEVISDEYEEMRQKGWALIASKEKKVA